MNYLSVWLAIGILAINLTGIYGALPELMSSPVRTITRTISVNTKNFFIGQGIRYVSTNSTNANNPVNSEDAIRAQVRGAYATIAKAEQPCFSCSSSGACGSAGSENAQQYAKELGYSESDMQQAPLGADLGLGCGNPTAIAGLKVGEVVVDLGSGGGFDCFLAAKKVGELGRVFGIDMTPEMLALARKNAERGGYKNVEFLEGTIEALPLPDQIADVIMSNCVVNLSPNKESVFQEAYRVLKIGGRVAISDVITTMDIPDSIKSNPDLYTGCITGACKPEVLTNILKRTGFIDINIDIKDASKSYISKWAPGVDAGAFVASAYIYATKK